MVLLRDTINERDMVITQLKMNINNLESPLFGWKAALVESEKGLLE